MNKEEAGRVGHLIWATWQLRNQIKQSNFKMNPKQLFRELMIKMEQFQNQFNYLSRSPAKTLQSHGCWLPPIDGHWKMNTDAAWFDSSNSGGVGWIIRDSIGSLIEAGNSKTCIKEEIKLMEARAILEWIKKLTEKIKDYPDLIVPPLLVEPDAAGECKTTWKSRWRSMKLKAWRVWQM